VLELAKIEACELTDLLKTVNERISVNKELSRGLGNVEVIFKELMNCKEGFLIEALDRSALENLSQE
jgi:hypothetical protein